MSLTIKINPFVKTVTEMKLVCPHCGEATNSIQHLLDNPNQSFPFSSKWTCPDLDCLGEYEFSMDIDRHVSSVVKLESRKAEVVYDLLTLPPQKEPVYLILRKVGYRFEKDTEQDFRNQHYFYGQHTCPTNWTGQIIQIISEGDDDPHGLFEFVSRQTKQEVEKLDILDKTGDIENGSGITFLNAFLPEELRVKK